MKIDPFELPSDQPPPPCFDPAPALVDAYTPAAPRLAPARASYVGPFDREAWPERLTAHVVSPGPEPRIHGYAVAGDLARHAGLADVAWLTVRGELPSPEQRAAFEAALILLAPVHVGQAPTHAALLSRIAGAPGHTTVAIGAVGLGEQAASERAALVPWLAWLDGAAGGEVPAAARADDAGADARAAQAWLDGQMRLWFGPDRGLPAAPLHRVACAHALLHRLGLRDALVVDALVVWARLLPVIAEAGCARPGAVRSYPARLPDLQYVDGAGASP